MTYARIENGTIAEYPVYEGDIQLRFPNTSFPVPFEPPAGYVQVEDVTPPGRAWDEEVLEGEPECIDGTWRRTWVVTAAPAEVIASRLQSQIHQARGLRNNRLAACDWTQLADAPITNAAAWATYRQALRDVPSQPGFPWDIEWPTEPSS